MKKSGIIVCLLLTISIIFLTGYAVVGQGLSEKAKHIKKTTVCAELCPLGSKNIETKKGAGPDKGNQWEQEETSGSIPVYRHAGAAYDGKQYYFNGLDKDNALMNLTQSYDPAISSWDTGLAASPTAVYGACAFEINGQIYLIGGFTSTSGDWAATDAVQIYDPLGDSWSSGASMPVVRGGISGGKAGGKIYIAGGSGSVSYPTDTPTYEYDPLTDTWTVMTACPRGSTGLFFGGGTGLGDKVYAGGDYRGYNTFYEFDPSQNTWNNLSAFPADLGKHSPCLVASETENVLYAFGGSFSYWGAFSDKTYTYNPSEDTWNSFKFDLKDGCCGHAGSLSGNKLYTFSGAQGFYALLPPPHESIQILFEGLNIFPALSRSGAFPGETASHTIEIINETGADDSFDLTYAGNAWVVEGPDNTGLIADGAKLEIEISVSAPASALPFSDSDSATITAAGVGDPSKTDTGELETWTAPMWRMKPPMVEPGRYRAASAAWGDSMYLLGGFDENGWEISDVDRYDYLSETWTELPPMSNARANFDAAALNGRIWIAGGQYNWSYQNRFEYYDIATDSWNTQPSNMPYAASGLGMGAFGTKIYVIGGETDAGESASLFEYDINSDTWTQLSDMPGGPRSYIAATTVGDKLYVVGGWDAMTRAEAYDISSSTWESLPGMHVGRQSPGLSSKNDDLLIVFGGGDGWTPLGDTEYYDIDAATWTHMEMSEMRAGRISPSDCHIGDAIYAAGGSIGDDGTRMFEILPIGSDDTPTPTATTEPWITPSITPTPFASPTPEATFTPFSQTVLLVDQDDDSPDVEIYYTETLDYLGVSYDEWDVDLQSNPSLNDLLPYPIVIWFSGDQYWGPNSDNETVLSQYLDSGGNLFLVSEDYLYSSGLTSFISDYLHVADYEDDVVEMDVVGADGDVIGNGLGPYYLESPSGFSTIWDDYIYPDADPGTSAPFHYISSGIDNCVSYSGIYKSVFFVWPIEALSELDDRADVMSAVLNFLSGEAADYITLIPGEVTGKGCIGETKEYVFKLTNMAEESHTFDITIDSVWPAAGPLAVGPVGAAEYNYLMVEVTVPTTATEGDTDTITITAESQANPELTDSAVIEMEADNEYWLKISRSSLKRVDHAVVACNDKIYVFGGYEDSMGRIMTTEMYDPSTGTWTIKSAVPSPGLEWRSDGKAIDGLIYIPGETVSQNMYIYDTIQDTWTVSALDGATVTRGYETAVIDGKLYKMGGTTGSSVIAETSAYDPSLDTWETKASMLTERKHFMSWKYDGKIYVAGGLDDADTPLLSTEFYDPSLDTWTQDAGFFASLPYACSGAADALHNDKMWLAGGLIDGIDPSDATTQTLYYDPVSNTWLTGPEYPEATFRHDMESTSMGIVSVSGWNADGADYSGLDDSYRLNVCAAPSVIAVYPEDGAIDVDLNTLIFIDFSESMDESSLLAAGAVAVSGPGGDYTGGLEYVESWKRLIFTVDGAFGSGELITVTVDAAVTDLDGIAMDQDFSFSFTVGTSTDDTAPAPVTGLNATDTPDDQGKSIDLSWDASAAPDLAFYKLYRDTSDMTDVTGLDPIAELFVTEYTDTDIQNNLDYYYAVTAVDYSGNENTSVTSAGPVQAVNDLIPAAPDNVTAALTDETEIKVEWDPVNEPDISGYRIHWGTTSPIFMGESEHTYGDLDEIHDLGTCAVQNIYVYAYSGDNDTLYALVEGYDPGSQLWDQLYSGTGGTRILLDAPLSPAVYTKIRIVLDDTENNDTIYYEYEFQTDCGDFEFTEDVGNVDEYVFSGLSECTNYYFVVTALDDGGNESVYSNVDSVSTGQSGAPAIPADIQATGGELMVTLDWTANTECDLAGYNIYRASQSGGDYTLIENLYEGVQYEDSPLPGGQPLFYVITAQDVLGNESAYSVEVSAEPVDSTPPLAPGGLQGRFRDAAVYLEWDECLEDDLAGYKIYYDISPGTYGSSVDVGDTTEYELQGLTNDVTYYICVSSYDAFLNEGDKSSEIQCVPQEMKSILLVEDDLGSYRYGHVFNDSLNDLGYEHNWWQVQLQGYVWPDYYDMEDYDVVIWTTGDDTSSTLTDEEQMNLAAFLDNGGHLFLSGQRVVSNIGLNWFVRNFLHVTAFGTYQSYTVTGEAGDVIGDGLDLSLSYPYGFWNYANRIDPDEYAAVVFNNESSFATGIRYPASGTGNYRVVHLAFPFEAVSDSDPDPDNRNSLMNRIMNWLLSPEVILTDPEDGETDVALNRNISVLFSEEMDETTMTDATVLLEGSLSGSINKTLQYIDGAASLWIWPENDFQAGETVTVTLTDDILDPSGIPLGGEYIFSFTAGDQTDDEAPQPVTGLVAQDAPDDQGGRISLDWDDNAETDLAFYNIYRDTVSFSDVSSMLPIASSLESAYIDDEASLGVEFYYAATATDNAGNEDTAVVSVGPAESIDNIIPPAPENFSAELSDDTSAQMSWDACDEPDVVGYRVHWGTFSPVLSGESNHTYGDLDDTYDLGSCAVQNIYLYVYSSDNDTLYAQVEGYDPVGMQWVGIYSGTGGSRTVLDGDIDPVLYTKIRVFLNDTEHNDEIYYNYVFQTACDQFEFSSYVGNVTEYELIGLNECTLYYFGVTSVDDGGNDSFYADIQSLDTGIPGAPVVPSGVQALSGELMVALTWTANTECDLAGYNIYRSDQSGGPYELIEELYQGTNYEDSPLPGGQNFYYVITAEDHLEQESGYSAEVNAEPSDTTPPAVPSGLNAVFGDGTVQLSWTANTEEDLAGYKVYYDVTPETYGNEIDVGDVTEHEISGLDNDVVYYFSVTAYDTFANESAPCAEVQCIPQALERILLVDDDVGSYQNGAVFTDSLDDLSYEYNLWKASLQGGITPAADFLNQYDLVIWTTGDDYNNTLTANDQSNLSAYLDQGGFLFLCSQRLTETLGINTFVQNYLHGVSCDYTQSYTLTGETGDLIGDGLNLPLSYPTGYAHAANKIEPDAEAATILRNSESEPAAIRYPAAGASDYRVVFFAFPFEAVSDADPDPDNRNSVMTRVMNWLLSPQILDTNPDDGAVDVPLNQAIYVKFSEEMDESTVTETSVTVVGDITGQFDLTFEYRAGEESLWIWPDADYQTGELITVTLTVDLMDLSGIPMGSEYTFSFTAGDAADTQAPAAVTGLTAEDKPDDQGGVISMAWDAGGEPDLAYYNIYREESDFSDVSTLTPLTTTVATAYEDADAPIRIDFYYAATAVDASGNEDTAVTTVGPVHSIDNLPPVAPVGLMPLGYYAHTSPNTYGNYDDQYDFQGNLVQYLYLYVYSGDNDTLSASVQGYNVGADEWQTVYSGYGGTRVAWNGGFMPALYDKIRIQLNDTEDNDIIRYSFKITTMQPSDSIELAWEANTEPDLAGYKVYYGTETGVYTDEIDVGDVIRTFASDLDECVDYYLAVTAYDESLNESGYSAETTTQTSQTNAPATPAGLSGDAGDGQITLSWDANPECDIDGYNVYRSLTSGTGYTRQKTIYDGTSYIDGGLDNYTYYYYVISAVDREGHETSFSDEISIRPVDMTPPAAPTGLYLEPDETSLSVSWNANTEPDLAGYYLKYGTESGVYTEQINVGNITSHTVSGLTNGQRYYAVVSAYDLEMNESAHSAERSAVPDILKPILLVDDDQHGNYDASPYFIASLDAKGFDYNVWNEAQQGGAPDAAYLTQYSEVIWSLGNDYQVTLSAEEQNSISAFLDAGGNLLLSGQYLLTDIGLTDFVTDYLHITAYNSWVQSAVVTGVTDDPIGDGLNLNMNYHYGYHDDANEITGDAETADVFLNGSGNPCGIRYPDTGVSTYRAVCLAFPLDAVASGDPAPNNQAEVLERILNWLMAPLVLSSNPEDGATDVDRTANVYVTFNKDMNPSTINAGSFMLTGSVSGSIAGEYSYLEELKTAEFAPAVSFETGEQVDLLLTVDIQDVHGTALAGEHTFSFTVGSAEDTEAPPMITGLTAADTPDDDGGSIDLNWDASAATDLAYYRVYRNIYPIGSVASLTPIMIVDETSTQDRTCTDGVNYYYAVTAVDQSGNEETSVTDYGPVSSKENIPPSQPHSVYAFGGYESFTVTWAENPESDLAGYKVYYGVESGVYDETVDAGDQNSAEITGLDSCTLYYAVVTAYDDSENESIPSGEVSAYTIIPGPPGAPEWLTAEADDNDVTLEWAPSPECDVAGYNVYRKTGPSGNFVKILSLITETTCVDENRNYGTTYYYRIKAQDHSLQESPYSPEASVTPENTEPPAPPQGIWLEPGFSTIEVNWTANTEPDMMGYKVYYKPAGGVYGPPVVMGLTTSYTIGGLTECATYYVTVTAYDTALNESAQPAAVEGITSYPGSPAAPAGLTGVPGDTYVDLEWDHNTECDIMGYNLYRSLTSGSNYIKILDETTDTSHRDSGLTNNTSYYYVVSAVDRPGNESDYSDEIEAVPTPETVPPDPVTGLSTVRGDTYVDLSWDQSGAGDFDEYRIYQHSAQFSDINEATQIGVNTELADTDFRAVGLTNGTVYWFAVTAVDYNDNEDPAVVSVSATPEDIHMPTALSGFIGIPGFEQVDLQWNENTDYDFDHYALYQDTSPITEIGGLTPIAEITEQSADSHLVEGLTNELQYYFAGVVVDKNGNVSAPATCDAVPRSPIPIITIPTDSGNPITVTTEPVTIGGTGPPDAMIEVYRGGDLQGETGPVGTQGTWALPDVPLIVGTNTITARSVIQGSPSSPSEAVSITYDPIPPAVTNLQAFAGDTLITLTWNAVPDADIAGYRIYRSTGSQPLNYSLVTETYFIDGGLTNGRGYAYHVTAVDNGGNESETWPEVSAAPAAGSQWGGN